jgi:transposase
MKKVPENVLEVKHIFCAIDLHKEKMLAGVSLGRFHPELREFDTDPEVGVAELIAWLQSLRDRHPGSEVLAAYEASGCGFLRADLLEEAGFLVSVLAPVNLPVTPRSRSRKTDARDVVRILEVLRAHVLAGNGLPAVWIPSAEVRDDREIVRRRLGLKEKMGSVKNQIHGLLCRYGLKKPSEVKTLWSKKHLCWLQSLSGQLRRGAWLTLSSLLRELGFYVEECKALEKEVLSLSGEARYRRKVGMLTEIPGVGNLTAMVFLTELGDLSRFGNRRELASYLGLTPRSWESGEDSDRKGHISKLGPARVRKVLNQAAWAMVRCRPGCGAWFAARTPKKKDRKRMIVAVMRKLGIEMWHLGQAA